MEEKLQNIIDLVKELSVVELNDLVKGIEEEFDVSAAPVMMAGGGSGDGGGDDGGKDTLDVELTEVGQQKISVIKAIKEHLGIGLKDAKGLVEGAPGVVKEGLPAEEAEAFKAKLEEAGATVTLK